MEEEIDLRQQLLLLMRHWKLIMGFALVGGIGALVVSYLIANTYAASALVTVSPPRISLQFEGVSQSGSLPVEAYPELALSNDVVSEVFAQVKNNLPPQIDTISKLARLLSADSTNDASLLRLSVVDTDPTRSATIANTWADVFAARAGQLYGQDNANLLIYEQQQQDALVALTTAENELATFQSINQSTVISAQLTSKQTILTDSFNRQNQIDLLMQDMQSLLARLDNLGADTPASLAEDLALLSLTSRLYGGQLVTDANPEQSGVQVQLSGDHPLTGSTVAAQQALARDLLDTLHARSAEINTQIAALGPELLALRGQMATAELQEAQLKRTLDLANDHYLLMTTQVQSVQIAVQESSNTIQVASHAAVPTEKAGPRRSQFALIGAALGFIIGVAIALGGQFFSGAASPKPIDDRRARETVPTT